MRAHLFDLTGKTSVVTGAARGLGRATALGLAMHGADVAVLDLDRERGFSTVEEILAMGRRAIAYGCDVADEIAVHTAVEQIHHDFGRIDILVNSAGIQHRQPAKDFDLGRWDAILSLMLTAVFELSQQAARVMERQGGGKIINIASLASFQGGWTIPAYTAAKHGVTGLTKALANEWAVRNIHVNAIAPGYFDTDMCAAIVNDPVREPQIRCRIPAGRWGHPADLVGPLLFLASDASNYVDGHILVVDGGWMGR